MKKSLQSPLAPLPLYNALSAAGWLYILYSVIAVYPQTGQPQFFFETKNTVTAIQCGAIIEVVNSLLGIVRSPLLTTLAQVSSRLMLVIGILQLLPETSGAQSIVYISLLSAWSITEVVRYLFYFCMLTRQDGAPKLLLWLRYNLFLVLYPTGVASELYIIQSALSSAEKHYSVYYKWILIFVMLTYVPGLPMLFSHMLAQRKKVMKSIKQN